MVIARSTAWPSKALRLARLLVLWLAAAQAVAQSPPPAPARGKTLGITELRATPAGGISVGSFHVEFEATQLDDIANRISRQLMQHEGDAGESVYWLCYTFTEKTQKERLWFISDGEMGGANHLVTGVIAIRLSPTATKTTECRAPSMPVDKIAFDNGLWLGQSKQELRSKLGAEPQANRGWWSYRYSGTTPVQSGGRTTTFDVTSQLDVELRDSRIAAIRASQIYSN